MFQQRLSDLAGRIDGALAVSLVGRDGILVESAVVDSSLDLEALAAELLSQVRFLSADDHEAPVGRVRQLSITTDNYSLLTSAVSDDYYLLVVLAREGSEGRARFELRRAPLQFERDLI